MARTKGAAPDPAVTGIEGQKTVGCANTPSSSRTQPEVQESALADHAAEIRRLGKRVVSDVIEIGARLTECKRICGHGNWLPWLDREFGWTDETAYRFIRVAELSKQTPQIVEFDLPVSSLYLLAAPSTPESARAEILERAATEPVSIAEVKDTIAEAKGRQQPAKRRTPEDFAKDIAKKKADAIATAMPGDIGPMLPAPPPCQAKANGSTLVEGDGEAVQLGELLRAWDRASEAARQKFMTRVGLKYGPDFPGVLLREVAS